MTDLRMLPISMEIGGNVTPIVFIRETKISNSLFHEDCGKYRQQLERVFGVILIGVVVVVVLILKHNNGLNFT